MYLQTLLRQTSVGAHCASISQGITHVPTAFSMLHLARRGSCPDAWFWARAWSTHSRSERQPTWTQSPFWQASNSPHCVSALQFGPQWLLMHLSSSQSASFLHSTHAPPTHQGVVVGHSSSPAHESSTTQRSSL